MIEAATGAIHHELKSMSIPLQVNGKSKPKTSPFNQPKTKPLTMAQRQNHVRLCKKTEWLDKWSKINNDCYFYSVSSSEIKDEDTIALSHIETVVVLLDDSLP